VSTENQGQDETAASVPAVYAETAKLFEKYKPDKYNRLLPTLTVADCAGKYQKPTIELVKIDPTLPERDKPGTGSGEVYQDRRFAAGVVALTRMALQKFQHAGGLIFPPHMQKLTFDKTSAFSQATLVGRKADGSPYLSTGSKLVDLELEEIKLQAQADKRGGTAEKKAAEVKRGLIQARENMIQNAETKAQNRAIRKYFALKDTYTVEELRKPFVLIRFDQAFDLDDPRQADLLMAQSAAASGQLFPALPVRSEVLEAPAVPDGAPQGQEVSAQAAEPDPLDEMDEPVEAAPTPSALDNLVALGYDELKKLYREGIKSLEGGEREAALRAWRLVHTTTLEVDRLGKWAELVLSLEVAE
jgi:hypothetical protein